MWKVTVTRSCLIRGRDGRNAELRAGAIIPAHEALGDGGKFIHLIVDDGAPSAPNECEFRLTKAAYDAHTRNGDLDPH